MKLSKIFNDVPFMGKDVDILGITDDSRHVEQGFMFAAVKGTAHDGHQFIEAALEKGATSILCEELPHEPLLDKTYVIVHDSRLRLAKAAHIFYGKPSEDMHTVAVTGTNGKTTTTHLIASILNEAGFLAAALGTLGTLFRKSYTETGLTTQGSIALAKTLSHLKEQACNAVVMEASSHALTQKRIAAMTFDVAVFLNLTQDHLDYHGTLEDYFSAKALLQELLKPKGRSVVNLDDPFMARLFNGESLGFSCKGDKRAAVTLKSYQLTAEGLALEIQFSGKIVRVHSPLIGVFNCENILAAFAAGLALGLESEVIVRGIEKMAGIKGRLERVANKNIWVDFAHTPDALQKSLETLKQVVKGQVFCVFGCGGNRDASKRAPMGKIAAEFADWSVLTSDNPREENPETILKDIEAGLKTGHYTLCADRKQAIEMAIAKMQPDDGVLIAGKGHETYQIIGKQKLPFDDRLIAQNYVQRGL